MDPADAPFVALSAITGLAVGSFLTVVIERIPRGQSIVRPRSACSRCGRQLAFRDLVPVLSWLLLRGRCRWCAEPIPAFYPLVEVVAAAGWGYAAFRFGQTPIFILASILFSALMAVTVMDHRYHVMPGGVLAGGVGIAALVALITGVTPWTRGLAGALLCSGLAWAAAARSHGGIGAREVWLAALLGLSLGWRLGLLAMGLAAVLGGAALLLARVQKRPTALAPVPFMAAGALVALFWGDVLLGR